MMVTAAAVSVVLLLWSALWSDAFTPPLRKGPSRLEQHFASKEDEEFIRKKVASVDANLWPPAINFRKESILFGEKPATQQDNNSLRLWRFLKQKLPYVITGARTSTACDDNPLGALYNMVLVRVPTISAGLVYSKNMIEGHPLIVDMGSGPFEMNPLIVFGVLLTILR
jgi:hypothetical protein